MTLLHNCATGEPITAVELYTKSIEESDDLKIKAHNLIGRAEEYALDEEFEKAYADCKEAIKIAPEKYLQVRGYRVWAHLYCRVHEYQKAIECLSKALEFDLDDEMKAVTVCSRGRAYFRFGNYELARIDLNHALLLTKEEDTKAVAEDILQEMRNALEEMRNTL